MAEECDYRDPKGQADVTKLGVEGQKRRVKIERVLVSIESS